MSFNKQQYDSYDWADTEDLFAQLVIEQERFRLDQTSYSSQQYNTVTNSELTTIRSGIEVLQGHQFIQGSGVNYQNIEIPPQYSYLLPKYFSQIQTELDKIKQIPANFADCSSDCGSDGSCDDYCANCPGFTYQGYYESGNWHNSTDKSTNVGNSTQCSTETSCNPWSGGSTFWTYNASQK